MFYIVEDSVVVEKHSFSLDDEYLAGRTLVEDENNYPLLSKYVGGKFYAYPGSLYSFDEKLSQWVFDIAKYQKNQITLLSNVAYAKMMLSDEKEAVRVKAVYLSLVEEIKAMTEFKHYTINFAEKLSEAE